MLHRPHSQAAGEGPLSSSSRYRRLNEETQEEIEDANGDEDKILYLPEEAAQKREVSGDQEYTRFRLYNQGLQT